uniref:Methyltransferase domain-containing protein n=1 Tax=Candidatus Kentrum sp. LFY TaxID=2126342 RepID=A0A450U740_9GAMM|nr:MAG: Methyltransferase domain-containing protein [Candidatus Kentron sp. LFY]VFJ90626.1 MAG: Methyltransferase domain-containing protein [Candidatus Kentron sp. LFY]VFK22308.1 MAG: Methyltransferase domain-containing protein [Candidatus Kentron sp. LFY]
MVPKGRVARATPRQRFHDWLSHPPGSMLLNTEARLLGDSLGSLFGYHLVQVGRLSNTDLLAQSRIPHRVIVEIDNSRQVSGYPHLRAEPDALPMASDSIDVIILPHVLEFSPHMQEIIKETKRVLVAEGHLLILAFDVWSLVGIWSLLFGKEGEEPWMPCQGGRFPGFGRVKGWITAMGFDVISVKRYFFRPPIRMGSIMNHGRISDPLRFLDTVGPRFWPFFSGAYLLVAKKRVTALTPRKSLWRQPKRPLIAVGLGRPSS